MVFFTINLKIILRKVANLRTGTHFKKFRYFAHTRDFAQERLKLECVKIKKIKSHSIKEVVQAGVKREHRTS